MLSQKTWTLVTPAWSPLTAEGTSANQEYDRWVTPGSKHILTSIKQDLKIVLFKKSCFKIY